MLHWTGQSGAAMLRAGFVTALYERDRPLDASRYYLIFPDNIGHGESSKPSDGLKAEFPRYGYGDMVDLQHRLVTETLGIKRLHAIVGVSMGGMNAWQWAERPSQLRILERPMPRVKNGKYAIQPASDQSSGHLTMASPELWADHSRISQDTG